MVTAVVGVISYAVELGLVYNGVAGSVTISGLQHPELIGNDALARAVAAQACSADHRAFDAAVVARAYGKGSWAFDRACA